MIESESLCFIDAITIRVPFDFLKTKTRRVGAHVGCIKRENAWYWEIRQEIRLCDLVISIEIEICSHLICYLQCVAFLEVNHGCGIDGAWGSYSDDICQGILYLCLYLVCTRIMEGIIKYPLKT